MKFFAIKLINPVDNISEAKKIIFRSSIVFYIFGLIRTLIGGKVLFLFIDKNIFPEFIYLYIFVSGVALITLTVMLQKYKYRMVAILIMLIMFQVFFTGVSNLIFNFKEANLYNTLFPILLFVASIKVIQASNYLRQENRSYSKY